MNFHRVLFILLAAGLNLGFAAALSAGEPPVAPPPSAAPPVRVLAESDVLALLTSRLQTDYVRDAGELELRLSSPQWKPRTVPDGPLTLKILEVPKNGVTPMFLVRFELGTSNQNLSAFQFAVQAHVWREVWAARAALKRGDLLAGGDIARERRDLLLIHEPIAEFAADDTSLELAEPVQAGTPLLARQIRVRPVIHRGQLADVLIQDGALSITLKVEALEDGAPGQMIRARNLVSRRDLIGKVLNQQTILVTL